MLLSCCFGERQKTKHKKRKDKENASLQENKDSHPPSPALTVHSATLKCSNGQDRKLFQEKHPPSKEEKRLIKQKSQDSVQFRSIVSEGVPSQRNSIITTGRSIDDDLTSLNLFKITSSHDRKESLPSPPTTPRNAKSNGRKCSFPEGSSLSAINLLETSLISSNSLITRPACHKDPSVLIIKSSSKSLTILQSASASATLSQSSSSSVITSQDSIDTIKQNFSEEESTSLNDAQLIEEKSRIEKEANFEQIEENIINRVKKEQKQMIQVLKDKYQSELEEVAKEHSLNLTNDMTIMKNKNEEAMSKVKSEANYNISIMHQQILLEREKLIKEQQENMRNLEQEYEMKDKKINDSFKLVEKREEAWQDEKADVIKEVQRLKAEAIRMVKILAMEYEEDNLNEDKKRSLSQEVYSLQLVVEMRTGEVRNLREQLNRATQQLEEVEVTKEKLEKATARMEDLEERLKIKHQFERQISLEKSQLEMTVITSNRAAERMSHNMEELQWRIQNNFDLPVEILPDSKYQLQRPSSFKGFCKPFITSLNHSDVDQNKQSTPLPGNKSDPHFQKLSFFTASQEMLKATSYDDTVIEVLEVDDDTSDYFQVSDAVVSNANRENDKEEDEELFNNGVDDDIDGDSLDEGLGDTSSDDSAGSPEPKIENLDNNESYNTTACEQAIINSANIPENIVSQKYIIDQLQLNYKQEEERRPSRISLETPL